MAATQHLPAGNSDRFQELQNNVKQSLVSYWKSRKKVWETDQVTRHFSQYLVPVLARTQEQKEAVFNIRHSVYCEELQYEPVRADQQEKDEFDSFSSFCLINHKRTDTYAGTVRMVTPKEEGQLLPIEKYCLDTISHETLSPVNFRRDEICEISRLAVPADFRRRKADKFEGAATGGMPATIYTEKEKRCFPLIAIGLYFAAAGLSNTSKRPHVFVMMEPRLARGMGYVGIKFQQIGPVVEYHGKRAPYYINRNELEPGLERGFKKMLRHIEGSILKQSKS
ncbi:MAG: N-acyl amino acid synthase of PEP-CTERM/exosortase system [Glaciecola sp.]|jgi:N-acyl amino acid synthase of PEP-CTERM/exosortase system